ncbi:MAG: chemotaxis protein CheW [Gomphosphaeria aponina SAG 52.96 = DSM 107014]|uniref:Chemotaxis protein CheW n=1 Tax=Gomphosphaeria aponina SAG 52.96 = DSM 107014 TaxID=1521640 RepID=A0A941GVL1_9CHRO|nr:chemotaxis protein CheW [Gomphosphaeria aponina SAG 52.96 = DSM 107014]
MKEYLQVEIALENSLAIPIEQTREVLSKRRDEICPICGVASAILGVINHRGKLLWVTDINKVWQLTPPQKQIQPQDKLTIIVLKTQGKQIGAVVARLKGIITLEPKNLKKSETILDVDAMLALLQTCLVKKQEQKLMVNL